MSPFTWHLIGLGPRASCGVRDMEDMTVDAPTLIARAHAGLWVCKTCLDDARERARHGR